MPKFRSGLFRRGSAADRADIAAFEEAVAALPAASRQTVRRMAEGEASVVRALRRGDQQAVRAAEIPWDGVTAAEKRAFARYIHSRPLPP